MQYRLRTLLIAMAILPPLVWWLATNPLALAALVFIIGWLAVLLLVPAMMLAFLWKIRHGFVGKGNDPSIDAGEPEDDVEDESRAWWNVGTNSPCKSDDSLDHPDQLNAMRGAASVLFALALIILLPLAFAVCVVAICSVVNRDTQPQPPPRLIR